MMLQHSHNPTPARQEANTHRPEISSWVRWIYNGQDRDIEKRIQPSYSTQDCLGQAALSNNEGGAGREKVGPPDRILI